MNQIKDIFDKYPVVTFQVKKKIYVFSKTANGNIAQFKPYEL